MDIKNSTTTLIISTQAQLPTELLLSIFKLASNCCQTQAELIHTLSSLLKTSTMFSNIIRSLFVTNMETLITLPSDLIRHKDSLLVPASISGVGSGDFYIINKVAPAQIRRLDLIGGVSAEVMEKGQFSQLLKSLESVEELVLHGLDGDIMSLLQPCTALKRLALISCTLQPSYNRQQALPITGLLLEGCRVRDWTGHPLFLGALPSLLSLQVLSDTPQEHLLASLDDSLTTTASCTSILEYYGSTLTSLSLDDTHSRKWHSEVASFTSRCPNVTFLDLHTPSVYQPAGGSPWEMSKFLLNLIDGGERPRLEMLRICGLVDGEEFCQSQAMELLLDSDWLWGLSKVERVILAGNLGEDYSDVACCGSLVLEDAGDWAKLMEEWKERFPLGFFQEEKETNEQACSRVGKIVFGHGFWQYCS